MSNTEQDFPKQKLTALYLKKKKGKELFLGDVCPNEIILSQKGFHEQSGLDLFYLFIYLNFF